MTAKIFIDGEYGTTGLQIRSRLDERKDIKCLSIPKAERHEIKARETFLNEADFAILCLPDAASRQAVNLIKGKTRIIDASTAHRLHDDWIFGFKELESGHAEKIKTASRVSNPGCYSTAAISLLRPLTQAGILNKQSPLTLHGVSGYTGGGRELITKIETNSITAPHFLYATSLTHKHIPEIQKYSLLTSPPIFTPSVGRFPQGMLVQVPLHMSQLKANTKSQIHKIFERHYSDSTSIRLAPLAESAALPRLDPTELVGTDNLDIHIFGNDDHLNLVASLDNLGKGASGACVQALDLMLQS